MNKKSFAEIYPSLLDEWDFEKNINIDPYSLSPKSNVGVFWICKKCGNKWEAPIYSRANGKGCKECCSEKISKKVHDYRLSQGSLESKYPDLAREFDSNTNGVLPSEVTPGCHTKYIWICSNNHPYPASPHSRTNMKSGCPYCAGKLPFPGENDFGTLYPELSKEWDYDNNGDKKPEQFFPTNRKENITWKCSKCNYIWPAKIVSRVNNPKCPECLRLEKEETERLKLIAKTLKKKEKKSYFQKALPGTSLFDLYPELMCEWDYDKNTVSPKEIKPSASKDVWWICPNPKCHHSYQATPYERTSGRKNCSVCSGHEIVAGVNDLETLRPDIAELLDTSVENVNPKTVGLGSHDSAIWKCKEYGHTWSAIVKDVVNGSRCPICSNKKVLIGFNDLATTHPELIEEWDFIKNSSICTPTEITEGSDKKVWWVCKTCKNKWQTAIKERTLNYSGCPECNKKFKTSFPEQAIYFYVKQFFDDAVNGYKSEDIGLYELDIYIPSKRIAIEYDGSKWHNRKTISKRDIDKYHVCRNNKIKLIRIKEDNNKDVNCDYSFHSEYKSMNKLGNIEDIIGNLLSLLGVDNQVINIDNDRVAITSLYKNKYDSLVYVTNNIKDLANSKPPISSSKAYKRLMAYHKASGFSLETELEIYKQLKNNKINTSFIEKWLKDDYNYVV